MAIFSRLGRMIPYQIEFAPFTHDLLLLQGSEFGVEYWRPTLEELRREPRGTGRIITCQWFDAQAPEGTRGEDVAALIQTLGLQDLHVVACDDAVEMAIEIAQRAPACFEKTLYYPQRAPRGAELVQAIREFSRT